MNKKSTLFAALKSTMVSQPDSPLKDKGYFLSYRDNIYGTDMSKEHLDMFLNGSGDELPRKARAVHSSSMLSYNMLSWVDKNHPFVWNDVKYTQVFFEVKIRTLSTRSTPANLDVLLVDSDFKNALFIESKFTEYFSGKKFKKISDSYKDVKNNYARINWLPLIQYCEEKYKEDSSRYFEGIRQNFCHLVALNNLKATIINDPTAIVKVIAPQSKYTVEALNKFTTATDIKFINVLFQPSKKYPVELGKYDDYSELMKDFETQYNREIATDIGLVQKPEIVSYSDLWDTIKNGINDNSRVAYLERRYMEFSSIVDKK